MAKMHTGGLWERFAAWLDAAPASGQRSVIDDCRVGLRMLARDPKWWVEWRMFEQLYLPAPPL